MIINVFIENRNEDNAKYMKAYMKNNFEYLGIKTPLRKELEKELLKEKSKEALIDKDFVKMLWNYEYRELQYVGLDYLVKQKKKLQKEDINFIKNLIITKSWWDTIDLIASHLVGELCKKYPELIDEYILDWSKDSNMWLRRTAILTQLKFKSDTKTDILEKLIQANIEDEEFFIRKAIGWALREYSKTNKEWVSEFVANNRLSKLSEKEASKYL